MLRFVTALVFIGSYGQACVQNQMTALNPTTRSEACIDRWQKSRVTLIVERECIPCLTLLDRIKNEMSQKQKKGLQVLWTNPEPNQCLEGSQRFHGLGAHWCVDRKELEQKWGVKSTPVVFWMEGQSQRREEGLIEPPRLLPWISSGN